MSLYQQLTIVSPLIILGIGVVVLMVLESVLQRQWPRATVTRLFLLAAIAAEVHFNTGASHSVAQATLFGGLIYIDPFANFITLLILGASFFSVSIGAQYLESEHVESLGEYYALLLASTFGAVMFAQSAELITLFLSLEIMSLAVYCMCGAALRLRRSSESALKYFLLGSFSSAFLLYGSALLYALSGTTLLAGITDGIEQSEQVLFYIALGMVLVGLLFKLGVVPFHFWLPDVYQGAPNSVTVFMATVIKVAAVAVTMRVVWLGFGGGSFDGWGHALWLAAMLTMVVGNLLALRQRSVKRMLAYSSIAHGGYMLMAFLAPPTAASLGSEIFGGGAAILFYLVAYCVMTIGSFAVLITLVGTQSADPQADDISRFNGLAKREPFLSALMALFMLSLAGIPPGMVGLIAKVYIFSSIIKADFIGLAIVGILSSAVSCYYYLRVVVAMYFLEPTDGGAPRLTPGFYIRGVATACAVAVVALGVVPGPLFDYVARVVVGAF